MEAQLDSVSACFGARELDETIGDRTATEVLADLSEAYRTDDPDVDTCVGTLPDLRRAGHSARPGWVVDVWDETDTYIVVVGQRIPLPPHARAVPAVVLYGEPVAWPARSTQHDEG